MEISFWDDVTVKTADLYRNVLQQMFTDVVGSAGVELGGVGGGGAAALWRDSGRTDNAVVSITSGERHTD